MSSSTSSSSHASGTSSPLFASEHSAASTTPSDRARHAAMVQHIADMTGAPLEEVQQELAGNYSIIAPMLAGIHGPPSPVLQYPGGPTQLVIMNETGADADDEEDEEEGQWAMTHPSPPPLMIPPPAQVIGMITPDLTPSPEHSVAPAYSPIASAPTYSHAPSYSSPPSSTAAESVAESDGASFYEAEIMDAEEDNHPGGDWQINFERELIDFPHAPHHYFVIPGRNNEDTIAPFVRYAMNLTEPSLQATMGKNCVVYTRPITARPADALVPALTPHQEWFFEENQPFSAAVDW